MRMLVSFNLWIASRSCVTGKLCLCRRTCPAWMLTSWFFVFALFYHERFLSFAVLWLSLYLVFQLLFFSSVMVVVWTSVSNLFLMSTFQTMCMLFNVPYSCL
jgi:hypothetical protein